MDCAGRPGYSEIRDFYLKMAKELDWIPGQVMQGMANSNVQLSLRELRKDNLAHITGMPMVSYVSMTMAGTGTGQTPAPAQTQAPPPPQHEDNTIPTSASGAVMKGLGGVFGKKKKQQEAQASGSDSPANPASTPGSLMDMQTAVTRLFQRCAGFQLVRAAGWVHAGAKESGRGVGRRPQIGIEFGRRSADTLTSLALPILRSPGRTVPISHFRKLNQE